MLTVKKCYAIILVYKLELSILAYIIKSNK